MSKKTDDQLLDVAKWWNYHAYSTDDEGSVIRKLPTDIDKRITMLADAYESLLLALGEVARDLQTLEGRGPAMRNVKKIITPDNVLGRNNG